MLELPYQFQIKTPKIVRYDFESVATLYSSLECPYVQLNMLILTFFDNKFGFINLSYLSDILILITLTIRYNVNPTD